MKNYLRFFLLLMLSSSLFGEDCTIYKNGGRDLLSSPPFTLETKLQFSIDQLDDVEIKEITTLRDDDEGNIYILDKPQATVFKFDPDMNLIDKFGKKGPGPGEFKDPYNLFLHQNHIIVCDAAAKKIVLFDMDGKFVKDIYPENNQLPQSSFSLKNGNSIAILWRFYQKSEILYMEYEVTILDEEFSKVKTLNSITKVYDPKNYDSEDFVTRFTVGKDEIYLADISEDEYAIKVYNFDGNFKHYIKKNFRKVRFSDQELADYQKAIRQFTKNMSDLDLNKVKYKKAINGIHYDHLNDYLLVRASCERDDDSRFDYIVDIFKDNKFLKRVNFNKDFDNFYQDAESKLYIKSTKNYLYAIDEDNLVIEKYKLMH